MIKKYFFTTIMCVFTICLVAFSSSNLIAAKNGLALWANSVIPSLFPFFVATELLSHTNMPYVLGRIFNIFMKPLFNISGEGAFALIMGIISGYPIGAKIVCNFRNENVLSKIECERLLSFTNNSGPLFIIGTVGISMFGSSTIGFLLLITHLLACFTVGFVFRFWRNNNVSYNNISVGIKQKSVFVTSIKNSNDIAFSNLGESLASAISSATSTIMMVGGFVVMFSVINSIFKASNLLYVVNSAINPCFTFFNIPTSFISPIFTGLFEITSGISLVSAIHIKQISINIIITAFLLGIGGLSVLLQVFSIVSKTDLSIKPYIIGKLLQGIFAATYTFIFIQFFPMFNFNL